jgi:hypothetical protein
MRTVADIVQSGRESYYSGRRDNYFAAVKALAFLIRDLANENKIDAALSVEGYWYNYLVKVLESEEAYHEAFQWHCDALWVAGFKERVNLRARDTNRVCFVVPAGVLLGHTQVMLQIIRAWRDSGDVVQPCVVALSEFDGKLDVALESLGVKFFSPPAGLDGFSAKAKWCRDVIAREGCNTAVWVSVPVMVSYLFGFGVAPRQVFWSLKFHPVHLGDSVTHIAMTPPGDGEVLFHGRSWQRFSPPLSIPESSNRTEEVRRIRTELGGGFLFGALARTEKFNSPEYVDAVAEIIRRCPGSVFLYTGHQDSPLVRSRFSQAGLSSALRFVGWVDTDLFAQVVDVFLETFPFGCGVTGAQAVNSGTRLVSLWKNETLPRYYFETLGEARAISSRWQVEGDVDGYKNRAVEFFSQGRLATIDAPLGLLAALDRDKAMRFRDLVLGP